MFRWLKKYFIPHEGNNFHPHVLRREAITALLLLTIAIELGFLVQVYVVFDKTKFLAAVLPGVLTSLTNDARADNKLALLTESELLVQAAQLKANDMAQNGYFAHTSPSGVTPWHWLDVAGYSYQAAGENLAVNFVDSEDVAEAWMKSPTHRANMVRSDFSEVGIAVAKGTWQGRSAVFVAQFFGKPFSAPVAQAAPPPTPTPPAGQAAPAPVPEPLPAPTPLPPPPAGQAAPTAPPSVNVPETPPETEVILGGETAVPSPSTLSPVQKSIEKTLTSPREVSTSLYIVIALIIGLALLLTFFIRIEHQHPPFLARGAALFAIVIFLLFVNLKVINRTPAEVPSDLTANVIYALPK